MRLHVSTGIMINHGTPAHSGAVTHSLDLFRVQMAVATLSFLESLLIVAKSSISLLVAADGMDGTKTRCSSQYW
jgi:hypothetical protein